MEKVTLKIYEKDGLTLRISQVGTAKPDELCTYEVFIMMRHRPRYSVTFTNKVLQETHRLRKIESLRDLSHVVRKGVQEARYVLENLNTDLKHDLKTLDDWLKDIPTV